MEASYPGFLKGLYSEYPWMTDQDRQLVALMCCGISPNAVSVIMGMGMNRLSKWKTSWPRRWEVRCACPSSSMKNFSIIMFPCKKEKTVVICCDWKMNSYPCNRKG